MYTGMADIAAETGDESLLEACRRLWQNIVTRQMYITGGIGATNIGEAFTLDYDLPNDIIYSETCASIGLIFFAHRMLCIEPKSCYADVIERALYNVITASMSKDGRSFFYVNPLEVWPEASGRNPARNHVKPVRQKWFGCACCPPNLARLLASLGEQIYTTGEGTVYTHLYISGEAEAEVNGEKIRIRQESGYPWHGDIRVTLLPMKSTSFSLALRIPSWCRRAVLSVNGQAVSIADKTVDGYVILERLWNEGDTVDLTLDMPIELIQSNPNVRANAGKVAIQRGPVVYCLEETDNGANLHNVSLKAAAKLDYEMDDGLLGEVVVIKGDAVRDNLDSWENELYRPYIRNETTSSVKAVPYCLWGNRSPGEMLVWIRQA
jgi:hypothetical protein